MATAYEFFSPATHMAQTGNVVSVSRPAQVVYKNPNASTSSIIYHNGSYKNDDKFLDYDYDEDIFDRADKYNEKYMRYNNDLFNRAMEYDKMMSDTAIQRQMEDMRKAGINPLLAGRYGGATYKGVNAPYISINPGSTLSALTGLQSTMINYNASMKKIASEEKISEREIKARAEIVEKQIANELKIANLTLENTLKIARENQLNAKEIAEIDGKYKLMVQELYNEAMLEANKKTNIKDLISSGVKTIGTALGALIISKGRNKDNNGSLFGFGSSRRTPTTQDYINEMNRYNLNSIATAGAGLGLLGLTGSMIPIY